MPLSFLMRLLYARLPVRVANPEDIRHVSVLLATGLIEAEIQALESTVRYATSHVATVLRITEAGFTELAKMGDARFREKEPASQGALTGYAERAARQNSAMSKFSTGRHGAQVALLALLICNSSVGAHAAPEVEDPSAASKALTTCILSTFDMSKAEELGRLVVASGKYWVKSPSGGIVDPYVLKNFDRAERYNLTVQAANYDLAAEAMRCMLNESKNFTEEGLAALTFSIAGQSVLADSEMRDVAAKNFLLVQDRLIKLQSKFVLGTPDLNKLRELAKAPADNVAVARLSVTQPAPQAEPDAEARKKDPAQAKQIDETRDLYFKELAFVQKANFEAPLQQAGAKDYRAKMAVCTAPIAG